MATASSGEFAAPVGPDHLVNCTGDVSGTQGAWRGAFTLAEHRASTAPGGRRGRGSGQVIRFE